MKFFSFRLIMFLWKQTHAKKEKKSYIFPKENLPTTQHGFPSNIKQPKFPFQVNEKNAKFELDQKSITSKKKKLEN